MRRTKKAALSFIVCALANMYEPPVPPGVPTAGAAPVTCTPDISARPSSKNVMAGAGAELACARVGSVRGSRPPLPASGPRLLKVSAAGVGRATANELVGVGIIEIVEA